MQDIAAGLSASKGHAGGKAHSRNTQHVFLAGSQGAVEGPLLPLDARHTVSYQDLIGYACYSAKHLQGSQWDPSRCCLCLVLY